MYMSVEELVEASMSSNTPISELMIQQEMSKTSSSREEVWAAMERNLSVMEAAVKRGVEGDGVFSTTGLTGGEAVLLKKYREQGHTLSGDIMMEAVQNAISTNEVNAS
ncbi:MAG: L-serine ammonia-lyase, iron-sulfur-dependent, subunit alpha, partial [Loigolactobacillus coryniformis]|nr:L-serine ammonia-lyase, iron-sulfur-dependent, subunit alpha [Loigolactobacillus coryniformis]